MDVKIVEGCPLRTVMDRFGDKWSVLVLQTLGEEGVLRFNEILKIIEDISQKMLSSTLRTLEETGLVERTLYPEIPPRVEYELTELGKSLIPLINRLIEWSEEHIDEINSACKTKNNLT
jgi:DNA-binding HxlR family transcriptional regulator